jgi:DNA modification methylase
MLQNNGSSIKEYEIRPRNILLYINRSKFVDYLSSIKRLNDISKLRYVIGELKENLINFKSDQIGLLNISKNGDSVEINQKFLFSRLDQIVESQSLERAFYYIERLEKSFTIVKTNKINDLNLNRWQEYEDIFTDSLWIIDRRDSSGAHTSGYWGNFIPQIPNQMLKRYTKKGEWVLDTFLGCGTTLIECQRLGRNGIGIELQEQVARKWPIPLILGH